MSSIARNAPEGKPAYSKLLDLYDRHSEGGAVTKHFVKRSALRPRRRGAAPLGRRLSKEEAQVSQRLAFLAGMGCKADPRRRAGIRSMAGNLFAYLAYAEKRAVNPTEVREWMATHAPGFDADLDAAVWSACRETVLYLPWPRELGDATGYTNQEWDDDGCPSFVWPHDIRDDAEIERILDRTRKMKAAIGRRERREENGARSHDRSKSALARFYNVHRNTIANMLADGRLHPDTGDLIDPETGEVLVQFRPEPREASYWKRTNVHNGTEPARAAAPPPKPEKDIKTMTDDASSAAADATRPIVAPGDDAPDDPAMIPTPRHDDPPGVPRTAPAAGAPLASDDARLAAIRAKAKAAWARVRADAIAAERADAEFFGDGDDTENKLFAASMSRQIENVDEEKDYAR